MIKHVCEAVQNGICGTVSKRCVQCFSGMCCPVFAIPERSRCFDLPASGSPKLYPSLLLAPTVGGRAPSSNTGSPTTPGLGAQLLLSQEPQSCRDPLLCLQSLLVPGVFSAAFLQVEVGRETDSFLPQALGQGSPESRPSILCVYTPLSGVHPALP